MSNNNQSNPVPQQNNDLTQHRSGTQSGTMNLVKDHKTKSFTQSGTMNLLKQSINNNQNTQQPNQTPAPQQNNTNTK